MFYRILANHTSCVEDKRRYLLDSLKQMQHAVTEQEQVVLSFLNLLPSHEEVNIISLRLMEKTSWEMLYSSDDFSEALF